jgi:hypothetical protein
VRLRRENIRVEPVPGSEGKQVVVRDVRTGIRIQVDVSRDGRERLARALAQMDAMIATCDRIASRPLEVAKRDLARLFRRGRSSSA